jgi:L-asparaginase
MAEDRRRVALIITGGTIDSVGTDRLDLGWYLEAGKRLGDGELLARVPELERIAEVTEIPFRRLPSQSITTADWLDLVKTIQDLFSGDRFDGVVITHGTNTLEETAYFLHLVLKTDRLLVVLNDTILGARDVTKTATYRVETFQGRDLGPLGYADSDGRVLFYHRPARPHTTATVFQASEITELPRVDLVVSYIGADGALIDAAVAAGARGLVSAGTGAGRPTPAELDALARAAEAGVVVCQGTRVGSGRTLRSPGLRGKGWVASDNLQPWKARVLLALALNRSSDLDEIQSYFDTY